jgi:predicted transcriptional regulator
MEETLVKAGLSEVQAKVYLYLLKHDSATPPELAKALALTRSNAYKILDKLVELELAERKEVSKKWQYTAGDPIALANMVAVARNETLALERAAKAAIQALRTRYQNQDMISVKAYTGKPAVRALYKEQALLKKPIHYVKARVDVTHMGFETLQEIRHMPTKFGTPRYGITQDTVGAPINPEIDKRTNLIRTWIDPEKYKSPVEWSVSGDELNMYIFKDEVSAVHIKDEVVAEAFLELWKLIDDGLRAQPGYNQLPKKARRSV